MRGRLENVDKDLKEAQVEMGDGWYIRISQLDGTFIDAFE